MEETDQNIEKNDLEFEPDAESENASSFANKDVVADLRLKLKKSNDEKQEYLTGWQRAKADFINARKQDQEANKLMVKFAEAGIVEELIPVLVSFDMAFGNKESLAKVPDDWRKGIEQMYNKLLSILLEHNVEVIDPLGKAFDPNIAEAVGMMDTKNQDEDHVILSVFQKGYKLHDRVISPAKVRVGKYNE